MITAVIADACGEIPRCARNDGVNFLLRLPSRIFVRFILSFLCAIMLSAMVASAQDSNGPLTPPPEETHHVHQVTNTDAMEAPPTLQPAEIIKAFSAKEDQFLRASGQYGYKKSVKITEFGPDGHPSGEFQLELEGVIDSEGRQYEKLLKQPPATLHALDITPANLKSIGRLPPYALVTSQLAKYNLRYIGTEKVDEVDCYIFEVKPKLLERANRQFQGVVWVDRQFLEVVKTYGKWVTDLGDEKAEGLPFTNYETYRENVDGKYWFPNYMRSDEYLHFKDSGDIPVRLVIKWADFKPLPVPAATAPPAASKP